MAVRYAVPPIITDGLVLYLDAANRQSYVSGSTTWYDAAGSNISVSLINGPTFSPDNAGSIIFDGGDDYGTNNSTVFNITDNVTLNAWIKESSGGHQYGNYLSKSQNNGYRFR